MLDPSRCKSFPFNSRSSTHICPVDPIYQEGGIEYEVPDMPSASATLVRLNTATSALTNVSP